jgi:DNA-binding NarL/FixJ family response regulator
MNRLSKRQREVLECLCQGMDNHEICHTLALRPGTVKTHIAALYRKFGVATRLRLVVKAYQNGWVRSGDAITSLREAPGEVRRVTFG